MIYNVIMSISKRPNLHVYVFFRDTEKKEFEIEHNCYNPVRKSAA